MLIGVKKRFVFIANSKTASTSIEHSLVGQAEIQRGGGPQRKHIYLRDALPEYDFLFGRDGYGIESFFTFGVMRDPVSWIQSWYRYRCGNKVESPLPAGMSFGEFWALKGCRDCKAISSPIRPVRRSWITSSPIASLPTISPRSAKAWASSRPCSPRMSARSKAVR